MKKKFLFHLFWIILLVCQCNFHSISSDNDLIIQAHPEATEHNYIDLVIILL